MRRGRCNRRLTRHWLLRHARWLRIRGIGGLRLPSRGRHRPGRLRVRRLWVWLALRLSAGIRGSRIWGCREAGCLLLRITRLLGLWIPLGLLLGVTLRRLLGVSLRRLHRVALLWRLGRITLRRLRRVTRLLQLGELRRLLRVATRAPGGSRLPRLPRGRRNRALLIGWDVGRRGTLEGSLASPQQIEEPTLVDIKVARQVVIGPLPEGALAALEFPKQVEGLPRAADPTTAGMGQGTALEGIHPVAARFVQLEHAGLGTVDHLVEEAKQADAVDGAEGGRGRLGALLPFALGELHTAVTGGGRPSLPV